MYLSICYSVIAPTVEVNWSTCESVDAANKNMVLDAHLVCAAFNSIIEVDS